MQWKTVRWYAPNGNLAREKSFRCIYAALASASRWACSNNGDATVRAGQSLVWGTLQGMPGGLPRITVRCPTCGKTIESIRDPTDPISAVLMETQCGKCVGSGFSFVEYFDAKGNRVESDAVRLSSEG